MYEIRETIGHCVDLIIDGGPCGGEPTTVVDMTAEPPTVLRARQGRCIAVRVLSAMPRPLQLPNLAPRHPLRQFSLMNQFLQTALLLLIAPPVLFAITVHEAAHGWVASVAVTRPPCLLGRVTFNPLKHIDPVGTVLVPARSSSLSKTLVGVPFLFGWAKPVPVDWRRLRNPRWDMALVAAPGPLVNLLMAFAWGLAIKLMALIVQSCRCRPGSCSSMSRCAWSASSSIWS
jgi:hypothetical protein